MHEDTFLRAMDAEPKDDAARAVYADRLEEQGDPMSAAKAEFLRLTLVLARLRGDTSQTPDSGNAGPTREGGLTSARRNGHTNPKRKRGMQKFWRKRLQQLAAQLEPTWLATVSHLDIENCQAQRVEVPSRHSSPIRFDYLCDRGWQDLQSTSDPAVRFCDSCRQQVHYCDTITKAREHVFEQHCIAVDIGIMRRDGDLQPPMMLLGMVSPSELRREEELRNPDPISAAREQRQRELTRARAKNDG